MRDQACSTQEDEKHEDTEKEINMGKKKREDA
jgi:hypothetical protein